MLVGSKITNIGNMGNMIMYILERWTDTTKN